MTKKTGPVWICEFQNSTSRYAVGSRPSEAVAECREAGLGTPSDVHYAGYIAEPEPAPAPAPRKSIPPPKPKPERSGRRVELVLTLYGLLRCDWPIGSILKPFDAAARLPSQSALRDFVANVGTAIQQIESDSRIVDEVIENQGNAWIEAAKEKNARRLGKWKAAEVHAERKIRYRQHAKRLRKRVAYHKAIGELASSIDGLLPRQETAAENFRAVLLDSGLGLDDVTSLVNRFRRITAPKL
jgi:hypothetical protein